MALSARRLAVVRQSSDSLCGAVLPSVCQFLGRWDADMLGQRIYLADEGSTARSSDREFQ